MTQRLRWLTEEPVPPGRALATGDELLRSVAATASAPAILYGVRLTGSALVLGRWQRADHAVREDRAAQDGVEVLRRATGGPTAWAGTGVLYAALALRHGSVLMNCPPHRILNRNVRGILGGLSSLGTAAHYFGREWLSVGRRPVGLVGWRRTTDGAVLLEFFVGMERTFVVDSTYSAYPARTEPPFLGKAPTTLDEMNKGKLSDHELVASLAQGHVGRYSEPLSLSHEPITPEEANRIDQAEKEQPPAAESNAGCLRWSSPQELPIGFLAAGLEMRAGVIQAVGVAGDFYQDDSAPGFLADQLVGKASHPDQLAAAVNATWTTARTIEGLRTLDPILNGLLEVSS